MVRFTLRQLEYFIAVGEAESIAEASAKMNVSSPSISAAIKQLEEEFGLPLFVRRHAQGLALTLAGRRMLEQAKLVLHEAESLAALAADISDSVRGPLSIGCLMTFAQVLSPTLRKTFEAEHAEVRVRQRELDQAEIFSLLRRAEIDVALTYDLDLPADLHFTALRTLPPYVVVGEDHVLADRTIVAIDELVGLPMVLLDLPFSSDYFLSFFASANAKPIISERTRDIAVMRSLVANGFGYSFINYRPLNERSPDGLRLAFIPIEDEVRPLRMGLLTSANADRANIVRAFVNHCRRRSERGDLPGFGASAEL